MNILALDTSSHVASVAVISENKLVGEYTINNPMTHSQKIMPIIDQLLSQLDLTINDMDYIAASRGPGSFTGVRIGIATVKGLAQANDIPIIPVSSLEAMAYNIPLYDGLVCPIMDARRNQVYTGVYKWNNKELETVVNESPMDINELIEILSTRGEQVIFLGDGLGKYKENIVEALGNRAVIAPSFVAMQRASSVAQLSIDKLQRGVADIESHFTIVPTYLRKSEAERQYEERIRGC